MEIKKRIKFIDGTAEVLVAIKNSKTGDIEVCITHDNPNAVFAHLFKKATSPDQAAERIISKMLFDIFGVTFKRVSDMMIIESIFVEGVGMSLHIHTSVIIETPIEIHFDANNQVSKLLNECQIKTADHAD